MTPAGKFWLIYFAVLALILVACGGGNECDVVSVTVVDGKVVEECATTDTVPTDPE